MSADISTREGLFAVMRQLAKEREEAKPRVEELLSRKELPWDEPIPEEWKTAGFVRELTRAAGSAPENDPPRGAALLQFAFGVANAAATYDYPRVIVASVFAEVLINLGWVEGYQGEFSSALKCFETALEHVAGHPGLGFDRARIRQNQGGLHAFMGQYDEAYAKLAEARTDFGEFSDAARVASSDLAKSAAQFLQGDLQAARLTLEKILDEVPQENTHTLATVFNNLAAIHALLGRVDETFVFAARARMMYASLGLPPDKPDWNEARVLLHAGQTTEALSKLLELRSRFQSRGLMESSAMAGLDVVDALLNLGRNDEALKLTEVILGELKLAEINDRIVGAISYLRDLLPHHEKAKAEVRRVRAFVEAAQHNRALLFVPSSD
jgi:tetratricopeptide (TPR) repeat protein